MAKPDTPLNVPFHVILRQVKEGDAQLLDVRPEAEYAAGNFPEAKRVPLSDVEKDLSHLKLKKQIPTYVVCGAGFCSMNALMTLKLKQGLDEVVPIREDYETLAGREAVKGGDDGLTGKHDFYDLKTIRRRVESGEAQLLDVRTRLDWEGGHVEQARLLPVEDIKAGKIPASIDRAKPTYTYSNVTDSKAATAAAALKKRHGFTNVNPLLEGYRELTVGEGFADAEPEVHNY